MDQGYSRQKSPGTQRPGGERVCGRYGYFHRSTPSERAPQNACRQTHLGIFFKKVMMPASHLTPTESIISVEAEAQDSVFLVGSKVICTLKFESHWVRTRIREGEVTVRDGAGDVSRGQEHRAWFLGQGTCTLS